MALLHTEAGSMKKKRFLKLGFSLAAVFTMFAFGACFMGDDEDPKKDILYLGDTTFFIGTGPWEAGSGAASYSDSPASPSGKKYISIVNDGDIIFYNTLLWVDLRKYKDNGWLHLDIYIDKPELVNHGQIEFTSSGVPDTNEYHFGEFGVGIPLVSGWNELDLNLGNLVPQGGTPNLAAINYLRIYFVVSGGGTCKAGLSNVYLYN
jgi:hypothetical protein